MIVDCQNSEPENWDIEQRADGTLLVRVPSRRDSSEPLPDAVFTFRNGDPQYDIWRERLARKRTGGATE